MKKLLIALALLFVFPCLAHAELTPADLTQFKLDLSSIISFFAGCLAIMGFIFGVMGGKLK
jgi:Flp pilus assembly protein protease CpaA